MVFEGQGRVLDMPDSWEKQRDFANKYPKMGYVLRHKRIRTSKDWDGVSVEDSRNTEPSVSVFVSI
jgi:hypothetical protein